MSGFEFADSFCGRGASVNRSANASNVAANNRRDQTAADLNTLNNLDVGRFRHRVGRAY